ncbi:MAG: putative Fe-S cluster assembly protein SufT [Deltaproteobacteria bacterium RIFOXYA12_FULL_58_15]|nr:MAG: putative Fe-S cluster assembly protein SufT [Deltaproteobacteria bacterium RIFOXYA12_FULL_58_15]OGR10436.1 MAG: putative Fe-S cluster assembly protein SufT [Deltaproteobacteria bacterium RIFOXYB12_FULL_58_9]
MSDWIELSRDCHAVQIPYGTPVTLRSGTKVAITQNLGDTLTVETYSGYLARIAAADADAVGLTPADMAIQPKQDDGPVDVERIREVLSTCYDPEIPVNIVELGLVYDTRIETIGEGPNANKLTVTIDLTLTAPGCGMGEILKEDIERKLGALPNVAEARVEIVLDPPWDPSMMSEAARLEAGLY